jgi:spoIIIJ-associated protein
MLDIAGHRDRRRKELETLATEAIADVKESGEPVRLVPMNPFERKIVHDVVAAAGLVSESEGEEPRRCVVVRPA